MRRLSGHLFFVLVALCGGFYIFFYRTIDSSVPRSGDLIFPSGQAQHVLFDDSMRMKNYPKIAGTQTNRGLLAYFKRLYEKKQFCNGQAAGCIKNSKSVSLYLVWHQTAGRISSFFTVMARQTP